MAAKSFTRSQLEQLVKMEGRKSSSLPVQIPSDIPMFASIVVTYAGPTDNEGSRMIAKFNRISVQVGYQSDLSATENAIYAAQTWLTYNKPNGKLFAVTETKDGVYAVLFA